LKKLFFGYFVFDTMKSLMFLLLLVPSLVAGMDLNALYDCGLYILRQVDPATECPSPANSLKDEHCDLPTLQIGDTCEGDDDTCSMVLNQNLNNCGDYDYYIVMDIKTCDGKCSSPNYVPLDVQAPQDCTTQCEQDGPQCCELKTCEGKCSVEFTPLDVQTPTECAEQCEENAPQCCEEKTCEGKCSMPDYTPLDVQTPEQCAEQCEENAPQCCEEKTCEGKCSSPDYTPLDVQTPTDCVGQCAENAPQCCEEKTCEGKCTIPDYTPLDVQTPEQCTEQCEENAPQCCEEKTCEGKCSSPDYTPLDVQTPTECIGQCEVNAPQCCEEKTCEGKCSVEFTPLDVQTPTDCAGQCEENAPQCCEEKTCEGKCLSPDYTPLDVQAPIDCTGQCEVNAPQCCEEKTCEGKCSVEFTPLDVQTPTDCAGQCEENAVECCEEKVCQTCRDDYFEIAAQEPALCIGQCSDTDPGCCAEKTCPVVCGGDLVFLEHTTPELCAGQCGVKNANCCTECQVYENSCNGDLSNAFVVNDEMDCKHHCDTDPGCEFWSYQDMNRMCLLETCIPGYDCNTWTTGGDCEGWISSVGNCGISTDLPTTFPTPAPSVHPTGRTMECCTMYEDWCNVAIGDCEDVPTEWECADKCEADPECRFYEYKRETNRCCLETCQAALDCGTWQNGGACEGWTSVSCKAWQPEATPEPTAVPTVEMFPECTVYANTCNRGSENTIGGNEHGYFHTESEEECMQKCAEDPDCVFYEIEVSTDWCSLNTCTPGVDCHDFGVGPGCIGFNSVHCTSWQDVTVPLLPPSSECTWAQTGCMGDEKELGQGVGVEECKELILDDEECSNVMLADGDLCSCSLKDSVCPFEGSGEAHPDVYTRQCPACTTHANKMVVSPVHSSYPVANEAECMADCSDSDYCRGYEMQSVELTPGVYTPHCSLINTCTLGLDCELEFNADHKIVVCEEWSDAEPLPEPVAPVPEPVSDNDCDVHHDVSLFNDFFEHHTGLQSEDQCRAYCADSPACSAYEYNVLSSGGSCALNDCGAGGVDCNPETLVGAKTVICPEFSQDPPIIADATLQRRLGGVTYRIEAAQGEQLKL